MARSVRTRAALFAIEGIVSRYRDKAYFGEHGLGLKDVKRSSAGVSRVPVVTAAYVSTAMVSSEVCVCACVI